MSKKEKIKEKNVSFSTDRWLFLTKAGVFLILLTPLIINPRNVFPSVFSKAIYFRLLVEIIFCFYLFLLFSSRDYLPKASPLIASLSVFVAVSALSILTSVNPYRSFWGTASRMEGFIGLIHFFIFFVVLVSVFKKREDWLVFLKFLVFTSLLPAFAGLCQKTGLFSFFTRPDAPEEGIFGNLAFSRVSATFGNPNFYASYLSIIIFATIFLAVSEGTARKRSLFGAIAGINFVMLLFTGTRGAWLGVFCGTAFLSFAWLFLLAKFRRQRLRFSLIILGILCLFLLLLLLPENNFLRQSKIFNRYESLFQSLLEFNNARIFLWEIGLKALEERPLFGFGPELFSHIYDKYFWFDSRFSFSEDIFFDRAHNKIIDTLVSSGIFGLLSYLWLFGSALFILWRHKDSNNRLPAFVLIALFLSYFVQNLFAFDMIGSSIVFFFILAFADRNFTSREEKSLFESFSPASRRSRGSAIDQYQSGLGRLKKPAQIGIGALTVFIAFQVNILPYFANLQAVRSQRFLNNGFIKESFSYLDKAFAFSDFTALERDFRTLELFRLSTPFLANQPKESEERQLVSAKIEALSRSLEERYNSQPEVKRMAGYLLLAQTYRDLYLKEREPRFLKDEQRLLNQAMVFNPQFIKIYRLLGERQILQGKETEAIAFFNQAYAFDKDAVLFNEWLGLSLVEAGQTERGATALRKAMRLGKFYQPEKFTYERVWRIAKIYEKSESYPALA